MNLPATTFKIFSFFMIFFLLDSFIFLSNSYAQNEQPLVERVNQALREANLAVTPANQLKFADMVVRGEVATFDQLVEAIREEGSVKEDLVSRVNQALREANLPVTPANQLRFADMVVKGKITTFNQLVAVMRGEESEEDLVSRVNQALREVNLPVTPANQLRFADMVVRGEVTTFNQLIAVMRGDVSLSAPVISSVIDNPRDYLPPGANYAQVPRSVPVYATHDDIRANNPFTFHGGDRVWVNTAETAVVGGVTYRRVNWNEATVGWIRNDQLSLTPVLSRLRGVDLKEHQNEHLAMVYVNALNVRSTPGDLSETARVGQIGKYDLVSVREQRVVGGAAWYRIGDNRWVHSGLVRDLVPGSRPAGVGPNEKWIEVNIAQQAIFAHEGDIPVYATLTSTGRAGHATITGLFDPWWKLRETPMRGARFGLGYDLADIPWTYYFQGSYAWHGTYWHDNFGTRQSAGCVNLSPFDAHWFFNWTQPPLPAGLGAVRPGAGQGTKVIVRST